MFYNAHVFVASKLYGYDEKLILVGSILPDVAITRIIGWENGLHGKENIRKFSKFVKRNSSSLSELCKGIVAHSILDDFTHKNYNNNIGYAYQNNSKLSEIIIKYYKLDNEATSSTIAHNYIESAVDIVLLQEHSQLQLKIKNAVEQMDINSISNLLGLYFATSKEKFRYALIKYFKLVNRYDLSTIESWVLFWEDLENLLSIKKTDKDQKKELLNFSINLVSNTYKDFINFSIRQGLREIRSYY